MVLNTYPSCTLYSTFFFFRYIALSFQYFGLGFFFLSSLFLNLLPFAFSGFPDDFGDLSNPPNAFSKWKTLSISFACGTLVRFFLGLECHSRFVAHWWWVFSSRIAPDLMEVFDHWDNLTRSQTVTISYSPFPGTWPIVFADTTAALTDRDGQDPGFYNAMIYTNLLLPFGEVQQLSQGNPWLSETWPISAMQFLQPAGSPKSPYGLWFGL